MSKTPALRTSLRVLRQIFPRWFLLEVPGEILRKGIAVLQGLLLIFPIAYLLRTLFAPWKGIAGNYPTSFHPSATLQAMLLTAVSRGVGFTVRFGAFAVGITTLLITCAVLTAALFLWLFLPLGITLSFLFLTS